MDEKHAIDKIGKDDFDALLLAQYPSTITSSKLQTLDQQRLELPETIQARGKDAYLTRSELITLMDWKLSHGKFRPALKKLIQENDDETVQEVTKEAFHNFSALSPPSSAAVKDCIAKLSSFRGVGPATASLLLSTHDPQKAPFFSDELFRWCLWQSGSGLGWDREIKYNIKEYLQLYETVSRLRDRLDVSCLDAEKVAYVLARQSPEMSTKMEEKPGQKRKASTQPKTASKETTSVPSTAKRLKSTNMDGPMQKRVTRNRGSS